MESSNNSLKIKLYRIVRKMGIPRSEVCLSSSLLFDFGFDSYDMKIFLFYLESLFNIEINDTEIPKLQTIEHTLKFIEQKVKAA